MDFAIGMLLTGICSFLVGMGIMIPIMEIQRQRMERELYHMYLDEMYRRLHLESELDKLKVSHDTFRRNKVTIIGKAE